MSKRCFSVCRKKEKKTKIKVDRTKISVIFCYMENKNTNTLETPKVRQTIKWNKFRNRWEHADVIRKENNTCATRANGRKFFGRYDANGNYHDVS